MAHAEKADGADVPAAVEHTLEKHWLLFLMEGAALTVLGAAAFLVPMLPGFGVVNTWMFIRGELISMPALTGIVVTVLFGWLLLMSGVLGLITTVVGRHAPGFWWSLMSSAMAMSAGTFLFFSPGEAVLHLSWILTAFLAADGIVTIMLAIEYRRAFHARWRWLLASGLVDLILAVVILIHLHSWAITAITAIMGIDFLLGGVSVIGLSLAARTNAGLDEKGIVT